MTTIRNIVEEMRQGTAYCEYWQRDWSLVQIPHRHPVGFPLQGTPHRPLHLLGATHARGPGPQTHRRRPAAPAQHLHRHGKFAAAYHTAQRPRSAPGLHVNVLTGNFRFHTPMMSSRPQWMPVSDIMKDDAAKLELWRMICGPSAPARSGGSASATSALLKYRRPAAHGSTIAPEMKLQEVMELFARMQNNGRKVTQDDIETMWVSPKWPAARSTIHDMIAKWQDTPLRNVVTKSNIIRVVGILLNGRQQRYGLSRAEASAERLQGAFAEADEYLSVIGAAMERQLAIRTKNAFRTVAPISVLTSYLQTHGGAFPTFEDEVKGMAYLLTTTLRGYRGGSSASSVNQELDALDSDDPWLELRKISDSRHGPSLTEPTRYDYQIKAPSTHHILVQALRMRPTCKDWVTGQALRDIDPGELVEHHLFSWNVLPDPTCTTASPTPCCSAPPRPRASRRNVRRTSTCARSQPRCPTCCVSSKSRATRPCGPRRTFTGWRRLAPP